jgi:hypothetical protein
MLKGVLLYIDRLVVCQRAPTLLSLDNCYRE